MLGLGCLTACGEGVAIVPGPPPRVEIVALEAELVPSSTIPLGTSAHIDVQVTFSDGRVEPWRVGKAPQLQYNVDATTSDLIDFVPLTFEPKRTGVGWIELILEGITERVEFETVVGSSSVAAVVPTFAREVDVGVPLPITSQVEYADGTLVDGAGLVTWRVASNSATIADGQLVLDQPYDYALVGRYREAWTTVTVSGR